MEDFIQLFKDNLEIDGLVTSSTRFRELDEWSSLAALTVLSIVDEEYDVALDGNEMRQVATVGELYNLIQSKR